MSRAHLENVVGAALGLMGVIAAPLLAADDWVTGTLCTFMLDALIWSAGALVLYLYGVRGVGGGDW